jgi:hypothetical protein
MPTGPTGELQLLWCLAFNPSAAAGGGAAGIGSAHLDGEKGGEAAR